MKTFNACNLVIIGSNIRYLMSIKPNSELRHVRSAVDNLIKDLRDADFIITLAFLQEFLAKTLKELGKKKKSKMISQEIYDGFTSEGESLEKVLLSEALTKKFYSLPISRYNNLYLKENPEKFLKTGAFLKLSEMARFDFTASCRCLLYGEATASAFHILRATEEVLKLYYFKHIRSKRLKPKDQLWFAMTSALEKKKVKKPSKTILDTLDLIRRSYRNPTQHPLIKYDIDEAQDLFGLCIDLINKLALEL